MVLSRFLRGWQRKGFLRPPPEKSYPFPFRLGFCLEWRTHDSNPIREQLRLEGFDLIDERLQHLLGCLEDALISTGETKLLPFLP